MPSKKKPKDPNSPKRPLSAYFLFLQDNREKIKEDNKDKKMTERTQMIAALWRELDAEKKGEYQSKAEALKEEFETRLLEYRKTADYAAYQETMQQWRAEKSMPSTTRRRWLQNLPKKDAMMDRDQIFSAVGKVITAYQTQETVATPDVNLSKAYGDALQDIAQWIGMGLIQYQQNWSGAIYAFQQMVTFQPKLDLMDLSDDGPHWELHLAMKAIEKVFRNETHKSNVKKEDVAALYEELQRYHQLMQEYRLGNRVGQVLECIEKVWDL